MSSKKPFVSVAALMSMLRYETDRYGDERNSPSVAKSERNSDTKLEETPPYPVNAYKSLEYNPTNQDLLVFNPKEEWKTKAFQINGTEFGPVSFTTIQSPLGIDAIIGMEFIQEHLIFIDFQNEKIYFSKLPEERSLLVRAYDFVENKVQAFIDQNTKR